MSLRCLLNSWHDALVDSESDGCEQREQRQVGEDADEREHRHGEEDSESNAEDDSRLLDIAPVDQWLHCEGKKNSSLANLNHSTWHIIIVANAFHAIFESKR